jgi:hypothetical protein
MRNDCSPQTEKAKDWYDPTQLPAHDQGNPADKFKGNRGRQDDLWHRKAETSEVTKNEVVVQDFSNSGHDEEQSHERSGEKV